VTAAIFGAIIATFFVVAGRSESRSLQLDGSLIGGLVLSTAALAFYQLLLAPMRGHSECWFRFVRSLRLLRPGARRRWRETYGRRPHLTGWDLWGIPYLLHLDEDVERERADVARLGQQRDTGLVWVGRDRRRTEVADLTAWLRDTPSLERLERLELRTSRPTAALRLVLMVALVPLGILMIRDGQWMGWPALVFTAALAMLWLVLLVRGNRLVLTPAGMNAWSLWRSSRYRWEDCRDFRPQMTETPQTRPVAVGVTFRWKPGHGRSGRERQEQEASLNDTYGHGAEELCEFLEAYRARSRRGRSRGGSQGARPRRP
jgi:hypothetical protein